MGNGYSSGQGTDLIWCSVPRPDLPEEKSPDNSTPNFVSGTPNVNHGCSDAQSATLWESRMDGADDVFGQNGLETTDFTLEFWIRRNFPDSITNWQTSAAAATGYCVSGAIDITSAGGLGSAGAERWYGGTAGANRLDGAGIQCRGANFEAFYAEMGVGSYVSRVFTLGFGWTHVAVTYDRSGNMEVFVNGSSQGTVAIDANALTSLDFVAMYCNITEQAAASGKAEAPYVLAGMAAHEILLTDAQISQSVQNLSLQTLGANTHFAFFYSSIRLRRSSWTVTQFTPTTQAETRGIFTSATRTELSTIIADARMQIVEVTAANTDTDNGGIVGAVQLTDTDSDVSADVEPYAVIKNLNIGGTVGDIGDLAILGAGDHPAGEGTRVFFSPALGFDPSWPPVRGVLGGDYA